MPFFSHTFPNEKFCSTELQRRLQEQAELNARHVEICLDQEPGSAGEYHVYHYRHKVLQGFGVWGVPPTYRSRNAPSPWWRSPSAQRVPPP